MKHLFKNRKGFTLIEFLIYMGIFSILLLVFLQMFTTILEHEQESKSTSSVHQDGQYIISRLTYDLHRAESVNLPIALGTPGTTLELVIDGTPYNYSLINGNLELDTTLNTDVLNGYNTSVSNLTFIRLGAPDAQDTVITSFTLTSKTAQQKGPEVKNYRITVGLR